LGALLRVGQTAIVRRTFRQSDFDRFAALSGDDNPIHVDPAFSAKTKFGRTVAHGMFLYSIVCGVLSKEIPGPGTVQLGQDLMFPSATTVGEEVAIRLEVAAIDAAHGLAELSTSIQRSDGSAGLQGRTLVRMPRAMPVFRKVSGPSAPHDAPPENATLKGLRVGQSAEMKRAFSTGDLAEYADLTQDMNPVFASPGYARSLGLEAPLIPGGLIGGLFSCLLGTQLPGRGTNYLKQRMVFVGPAHPGQQLTARVSISRIRPEKQLVNLRTTCTGPDGLLVCQGEALVLVSDVGQHGA